MTRPAVRLHAVVKHPLHRGRGNVIELVTNMALITWPREGYDVTWLGAETLQVVKYRTPSPASKRRLAAKISRAQRRIA